MPIKDFVNSFCAYKTFISHNILQKIFILCVPQSHDQNLLAIKKNKSYMIIYY